MRLLPSPVRPLPLVEFVVLMAVLFSLLAFSIDSMLPSFPQIGAEMAPGNPNRAQLVITAFVLGMGLGQIVVGPLSDALGRRAVILMGILLYMLAAFAAGGADSMTWLLVFRFFQGVGASAPRTVGSAIMRDLYQGRMMARVSSFTFMVFVTVPAVAPYIGQLVISAWDWRAMFVLYILMGLSVGIWFAMRQPETLPPERRIPVSLTRITGAAREVLTHRSVLIYIGVLSCGFGLLMAYISSAQQIYVDVLNTGERFPLFFASITLVSVFSAWLNARLVMGMGMRRLVSLTYGMQAIVATTLWLFWSLGWITPGIALPVFLAWSATVFFMNGLNFGNLNALALEPMGHIAGTASALVGAISTTVAVAIAVPIGLAFNGTPVPLIAGTAICSVLAWIGMQLPEDD